MEVFVELHRKMSPGEKLEQALRMTEMVWRLAETGVRQRHPDAGEREVFLRFAALHLDRDLMLRVYGWRP